jgi:hypothetical protein
VVVQAQPLGLGDRALELAVACHRRDVEQRAVDGGDRDAFVVADVLGIEGACAVQADGRGAVAPAGRGDVDARLVGVKQPQCAAAVRCESTAPGPHASTAASRWPSGRSAVCPTA